MNKPVKAIELSDNVRRWNPERGLQMQSHFRDTTLGGTKNGGISVLDEENPINISAQ
jgi:hypothetical protein